MTSRADSQAAAGWVARLSGKPGEADWLAFEAWLNGAPGRRRAYDQALSLSLAIDHEAEALSGALGGEPLRRPRGPRRGPGLLWGGAMMGVAVLAVAFAALNPRRAVAPDVYSTARGERREVALADGTKVALNADTSLSVRIERKRREIVMASGEAAFQVAHDPSRPFVVRVGDRTLHDIGTDFDVQRRDGLITVTVREGMVGVQRDGEAARMLSLGPGGRFQHREGSAESVVQAADTDEAFSWRSGRLIYRNRPLSEVAADLSRYGRDTVRTQGPAGALRFTGVLTIDNQAAMVRRLTSLAPVSSARRDGVILLSELNSAR